jgi:hypothetical protein
MSKVEEIEAELQHLSKAELGQLRRSLDDLLEDELEFTPEFEAALQNSEHEKAKGVHRTRNIGHRGEI